MNDLYLICVYNGDRYTNAYCMADYEDAIKLIELIPRNFNVKLYKVNTRIKTVTEL